MDVLDVVVAFIFFRGAVALVMDLVDFIRKVTN